MFNFASTYYIYAIYQKLSPIYYICLHRLNVLILTILGFINALINVDIDNVYISTNICEILTLIFYILGSIVYLEFIELNFCRLNIFTKRNIKERANRDIINSDIDLNSIDE